jgi:hypothetical protein
MSTHPSGTSAPQDDSSAFTVGRAILYATLIAGALDATDGVIFFGLHGLNPIQVLQFIASGLLGAAAFTGGLATAGVGVLVHFAITAVVAAIYILASQRLSALRSQWRILGPCYGAAVWMVMNLIVLPHSAVAQAPITTATALNGIIGHALLIGLPIAYFANRTTAWMRPANSRMS